MILLVFWTPTINEDDKCRLCKEDTENTEHILRCTAIQLNPINALELKQTEDFNVWSQIVLRVQQFEKMVMEQDTLEEENES